MMGNLLLYLFFKFFIDYATCPSFSLFAPFHQAPQLPPAILTSLFISMGHISSLMTSYPIFS